MKNINPVEKLSQRFGKAVKLLPLCNVFIPSHNTLKVFWYQTVRFKNSGGAVLMKVFITVLDHIWPVGGPESKKDDSSSFNSNI